MFFRFIRLFFLFFLEKFLYSFKAYTFIFNDPTRKLFRLLKVNCNFKTFYSVSLSKKKFRKYSHFIYLLNFFFLKKKNFLSVFLRLYILNKRNVKKIKKLKLYKYIYILISNKIECLSKKFLIFNWSTLWN